MNFQSNTYFFTPKTEIKLKTDEIFKHTDVNNSREYLIQKNNKLLSGLNLFNIPLSRGLDVTLGFIRIRYIMLTKVQCCKGCN